MGFVQGLLIELSARATAVWFHVSAKGHFERVASADSEPGDLFLNPNLIKIFPEVFAAAIQTREPRILNVVGLIDPTGTTTLFIVPLFQGTNPIGLLGAISKQELTADLVQQHATTLVNRGHELTTMMFTPAMPPPSIAAAQQPGVELVPKQEQPVDPKLILNFILSLQSSLDLNEVGNVAVNDGRLLFGADRVSLVLKRGSKTVVTAVSGQIGRAHV